MVLIQCIIMNNCRLCYDKPGFYNLKADKKLMKEIYECIKIKVNDKVNSSLPQCICEECKNTIESFFSYKQQIQKVDQSLRKTLLNLNAKYENSSTEDSFKCPECPGTFQVQNTFENHLQSHSSQYSNYKKDSSSSTSQDDYHSRSCNDLKETEHCSYENNYDNSHLINNCDGSINQDLDLIMKQNHSPGVESENTLIFQKKSNKDMNKKCLKAMTCNVCNQKFKTKEELRTHKKIHKTKYICPWKSCKKILNSAYTLRTHELKHAGKRSFLCVTCGKGFITKNSLTCHEKIHLDVKGYICKLCNIGFSVRSNLRAHEKKHHEGVRFYCSQCTKAFVSKCSLERHERIHTGVKEFQCESCPSAFYTNKELVKHQRYHQGLRLHKCNECFKTFFERHHLVIHLRSHTGERPYVCKVPNCGKSFMESQKLKRHHKAKHVET